MNLAVTLRARSLANILADLREARADLDLVAHAIDADAADRYAEAETRLADLQAEFDVRLAEATGINVEDFRAAYAEALI